MDPPQKIIVVGAGPVGSLAALYAAQRGYNVEIYELRSDLRDPTTTPLNFTKSINLALSARGITAMSEAKRPDLLASVMKGTIEMTGRMVHRKSATGDLFEESQAYDAAGRAIFAVDRGELNKHLLDELEAMPNVAFFFNHKMTGADFKRRKAWFENKLPGDKTRGHELEVDFDLLIGADGAHSAARFHLMKFVRMDYSQEYIDTLWCEFTIRPGENGAFRISPHHLHIWPGKEFMFIAIPSLDGSFTCTLFLPSAYFESLEADLASIPAFFDQHFPGVTQLIPAATLVSSFRENPHLPLISIKCQPYHHADSAVILGDAAHAMVPFYGQGMNAGLEDVAVLFSILDRHVGGGVPPSSPSPPPSISSYSPAATAAAAEASTSPSPTATAAAAAAAALTASRRRRGAALAEYSRTRVPDARAINDLAFANYVEMRASVVSPLYRLRKALEELLSLHAPALGWQTQYARVSFGTERYSEVAARSERQRRWLVGWMAAAGLVAAGGLARRAWWRGS